MIMTFFLFSHKLCCLWLNQLYLVRELVLAVRRITYNIPATNRD